MLDTAPFGFNPAAPLIGADFEMRVDALVRESTRANGKQLMTREQVTAMLIANGIALPWEERSVGADLCIMYHDRAYPATALPEVRSGDVVLCRPDPESGQLAMQFRDAPPPSTFASPAQIRNLQRIDRGSCIPPRSGSATRRSKTRPTRYSPARPSPALANFPAHRLSRTLDMPADAVVLVAPLNGEVPAWWSFSADKTDSDK